MEAQGKGTHGFQSLGSPPFRGDEVAGGARARSRGREGKDWWKRSLVRPENGVLGSWGRKPGDLDDPVL